MNETYLYPYSAQEARTRNQLPMWRESYHANVACRNAIEETIRQSFDGMHLKKDCLEPVLAEYGYKRTEWVLATTLQELSWDGRFSRTNKQWAARRYIPQDERHNAEITVRSHPAILDGFVDLYAYLIRRLTPLECERLQGFPDGWTDIPDASDSARYKALGNSVYWGKTIMLMMGTKMA